MPGSYNDIESRESKKIQISDTKLFACSDLNCTCTVLLFFYPHVPLQPNPKINLPSLVRAQRRLPPKLLNIAAKGWSAQP